MKKHPVCELWAYYIRIGHIHRLSYYDYYYDYDYERVDFEDM